MLSIKRFWSEVENFAKELEYDFTRIEDIGKVIGLEQEDKEHELFNIILLIAKNTIHKCRLKATPLNRFIKIFN